MNIPRCYFLTNIAETDSYHVALLPKMSRLKRKLLNASFNHQLLDFFLSVVLLFFKEGDQDGELQNQ